MLPPRFVVMLANYVEEKLPTLASGDLTLTLSDEAVAYLSRRLTAFQVEGPASCTDGYVREMATLDRMIRHIASVKVSGKTEVDPSDDGAGDRHVVNVVLSPFHSLVRLEAKNIAIDSLSDLHLIHHQLRVFIFSGQGVGGREAMTMRRVLVDAALEPDLREAVVARRVARAEAAAARRTADRARGVEPSSDDSDDSDSDDDDDMAGTTVVWPLIRSFCMTHAGVERVGALAAIPHVETIDLSHNRIETVEGFLVCPHLENLCLQYNAITDLRMIFLTLGNIKYLNLRSNGIAVLEGLEKLFGLEELDVAHNVVTDFKEVRRLAKLPCLASLTMVGNPISFHELYKETILQDFAANGALMELDGVPLTKQEMERTQRVADMEMLAALTGGSNTGVVDLNAEDAERDADDPHSDGTAVVRVPRLAAIHDDSESHNEIVFGGGNSALAGSGVAVGSGGGGAAGEGTSDNLPNADLAGATNAVGADVELAGRKESAMELRQRVEELRFEMGDRWMVVLSQNEAVGGKLIQRWGAVPEPEPEPAPEEPPPQPAPEPKEATPSKGKKKRKRRSRRETTASGLTSRDESMVDLASAAGGPEPQDGDNAEGGKPTKPAGEADGKADGDGSPEQPGGLALPPSIGSLADLPLPTMAATRPRGSSVATAAAVAGIKSPVTPGAAQSPAKALPATGSPGMPSMTGIPGIPTLPGMTGMPGMPGMPTMPAMPSAIPDGRLVTPPLDASTDLLDDTFNTEEFIVNVRNPLDGRFETRIISISASALEESSTQNGRLIARRDTSRLVFVGRAPDSDQTHMLRVIFRVTATKTETCDYELDSEGSFVEARDLLLAMVQPDPEASRRSLCGNCYLVFANPDGVKQCPACESAFITDHVESEGAPPSGPLRDGAVVGEAAGEALAGDDEAAAAAAAAAGGAGGGSGASGGAGEAGEAGAGGDAEEEPELADEDIVVDSNLKVALSHSVFQSVADGEHFLLFQYCAVAKWGLPVSSERMRFLVLTNKHVYILARRRDPDGPRHVVDFDVCDTQNVRDLRRVSVGLFGQILRLEFTTQVAFVIGTRDHAATHRVLDCISTNLALLDRDADIRHLGPKYMNEIHARVFSPHSREPVFDVRVYMMLFEVVPSSSYTAVAARMEGAGPLAPRTLIMTNAWLFLVDEAYTTWPPTIFAVNTRTASARDNRDPPFTVVSAQRLTDAVGIEIFEGNNTRLNVIFEADGEGETTWRLATASRESVFDLQHAIGKVWKKHFKVDIPVTALEG